MANGSTVPERLTRLESGQAVLSQDMSQIKQSIDGLSSALNSSKVTNWPFMLSAMGAIGVLFGGVYNTLLAKQETAALRSEMSIMERVQPVVIAAEQSKSDRESIHDKVELNSVKLAQVSAACDARYAEFKSSVAEAEAQFKAAGNIANLRNAEYNRLFALLWEQSFKTPLPISTFNPSFHREFLPQ